MWMPYAPDKEHQSVRALAKSDLWIMQTLLKIELEGSLVNKTAMWPSAWDSLRAWRFEFWTG
jgi:hypothetical protein